MYKLIFEKIKTPFTAQNVAKAAKENLHQFLYENFYTATYYSFKVSL